MEPKLNKEESLTERADPITFPTNPDSQGFYYANQDEKDSDILTKDYENGSQVKKITLSNNSIAIVRKLKGIDLMNTKKIMAANNEKDPNLFEVYNLSIGTTIDGQNQPVQFYLNDLYQADLASLLGVFTTLNFQ